MKDVIILILTLCGLASSLHAEEGGHVQLDCDVKFTRIRFQAQLTVPGVPEEAYRTEVLFSKTGNVTVSLDGVSESFESYKGLKADESTEGIMNLYTVTVLVETIAVLNGVIKEHASLFRAENSETADVYLYYGKSLGMAINYEESIAYNYKGRNIIIRCFDLYGPRLVMVEGVKKEDQIKAFIIISGAMNIFNDISASISGNHNRRPSYQDFFSKPIVDTRAPGL